MNGFDLLDVVHLHAIGNVFILVGFLIATTLLHQRPGVASKAALLSAPPATQTTALFESAAAYFDRRTVGNAFVSPGHVIPMLFLIAVVLLCSIGSYFGAEFFTGWTTPSYILGGAYAITPATDASWRLEHDQSSTVFIGAYIWMISNNDMGPTAYYTARPMN